MIRSGWTDAHSSKSQSFQARTQAAPSARSSAAKNTRPQKPEICDGKLSEAQTPFRSMSATRASTS